MPTSSHRRISPCLAVISSPEFSVLGHPIDSAYKRDPSLPLAPHHSTLTPEARQSHQKIPGRPSSPTPAAASRLDPPRVSARFVRVSPPHPPKLCQEPSYPPQLLTPTSIRRLTGSPVRSKEARRRRPPERNCPSPWCLPLTVSTTTRRGRTSRAQRYLPFPLSRRGSPPVIAGSSRAPASLSLSLSLSNLTRGTRVSVSCCYIRTVFRKRNRAEYVSLAGLRNWAEPFSV